MQKFLTKFLKNIGLGLVIGLLSFGTIAFADRTWTPPDQTGHAGQYLQTDGTNTLWNTPGGGGSGTVTSVNASGGTTGLSFSGGPITTSGTLTMGGTLGIANGGTGQTTAQGAIDALLPSQAGNAGYLLTTNGTNASWVNPTDTSSAITSLVATTTFLPLAPTYYNGPANDGVGATLTASSVGALGPIDTVTLALNDRVLVKNQTNQIQNGVYALTTVGNGSTAYVLTRTLDADETADFDDQVVIPSNGSVNVNQPFGQTTAGPILGTDSIVYGTVASTYVSQSLTGTQTNGNIPYWTANNRQLSRGDIGFRAPGTTWSTSQLQVGKSSQGGRINIVRGTDGSVSGYFGMSSATSAGGMVWANSSGNAPTNTISVSGSTTPKIILMAGTSGTVAAPAIELGTNNATRISIGDNGLSFIPFGTSSGNTYEERFLELAANGTNYVGFKAPDSIASNHIWTLPSADGTSGQALVTNGSGTLSFTTLGLPSQTGHSGEFLSTDGTNAAWTAVSLTPAGSDTYIQYNDAGAFGGDGNFVWDKNSLTFAAGDLATASNGTQFQVSDASQQVFGTVLAGGIENKFIASTSVPLTNGEGAVFYRGDAGHTVVNGVIDGTPVGAPAYSAIMYANDGGTGDSGAVLAAPGLMNITADDFTGSGSLNAVYSDGASFSSGIVANISGLSLNLGSGTLHLPTTLGSNGQILVYNGGGNMIWASSGNITGSGTSGQVTYFDGTNSISSDSDFTWNNLSRAFSVGDVSLTNNGTLFQISDSAMTSQLQAKTIALGDVFATTWNGVKAEVDNVNNRIRLTTGASGTLDVLGNNSILFIKPDVGTFEIGDITSGYATDFIMEVNPEGSNQFVSVSKNGNNLFLVDRLNEIYGLGDIDNAGNSNKIVIDDSTSEITIQGGMVYSSIGSQNYGTTNTLSVGTQTYLVGASGSGATTVTLPTSTASVGTIFVIKDIGVNASSNNITVDAGTGNSIVGTTSAQTYVMSTDGESITIQKVNSTTWIIINKF